MAALDRLMGDLAEGGEAYAQLNEAARARVEKNFCWDSILYEMVKPGSPESPPLHRQRHKSSIKRLLKLASNMMVG